MIDERKNVQTTPPAPPATAVGPCPTIIQISRTPRHWKFTQHHRTTRPPRSTLEQLFQMKVRQWRFSVGVHQLLQSWQIWSQYGRITFVSVSQMFYFCVVCFVWILHFDHSKKTEKPNLFYAWCPMKGSVIGKLCLSWPDALKRGV